LEINQPLSRALQEKPARLRCIFCNSHTRPHQAHQAKADQNLCSVHSLLGGADSGQPRKLLSQDFALVTHAKTQAGRPLSASCSISFHSLIGHSLRKFFAQVKRRATAALGCGYARRANTKNALPLPLPAGRAARSAETRHTVNWIDTSRRKGRERKSPTFSQKPQKYIWFLSSRSRGQSAPQLRLPCPRLGHLLKAPRLSLADRSMYEFQFSHAPDGGKNSPPSIWNFPISSFVETI
jgi:hypothetical protein